MQNAVLACGLAVCSQLYLRHFFCVLGSPYPHEIEVKHIGAAFLGFISCISEFSVPYSQTGIGIAIRLIAAHLSTSKFSTLNPKYNLSSY